MPNPFSARYRAACATQAAAARSKPACSAAWPTTNAPTAASPATAPPRAAAGRKRTPPSSRSATGRDRNRRQSRGAPHNRSMSELRRHAPLPDRRLPHPGPARAAHVSHATGSSCRPDSNGRCAARGGAAGRRQPRAPRGDPRVHRGRTRELRARVRSEPATDGPPVPGRLPAPQPCQRRDLGRGGRHPRYPGDALPPAQTRPPNPTLPALRRHRRHMTASIRRVSTSTNPKRPRRLP